MAEDFEQITKQPLDAELQTQTLTYEQLLFRQLDRINFFSTNVFYLGTDKNYYRTAKLYNLNFFSALMALEDLLLPFVQNDKQFLEKTAQLKNKVRKIIILNDTLIQTRELMNEYHAYLLMQLSKTGFLEKKTNVEVD